MFNKIIFVLLKKNQLLELLDNNILITFKYTENKILTHIGRRVLQGLLFNSFSKRNQLYENERLTNADKIAAGLSIFSFIRSKVLSVNLKTYKIDSGSFCRNLACNWHGRSIFLEMVKEKSKVYAIVF